MATLVVRKSWKVVGCAFVDVIDTHPLQPVGSLLHKGLPFMFRKGSELQSLFIYSEIKIFGSSLQCGKPHFTLHLITVVRALTTKLNPRGPLYCCYELHQTFLNGLIPVCFSQKIGTKLSSPLQDALASLVDLNLRS